ALGDSGGDQSFIRTLHKRGFRFVGDVEEDSSAPAARAGDQPPSTPAAAHEAAKLVPDAEPLPLPDKPSIAVLPFQNMSRDPDQEYFADGLTEDIITGLSRQRWFFVIARNSSVRRDHRGVPRDGGLASAPRRRLAADDGVVGIARQDRRSAGGPRAYAHDAARSIECPCRGQHGLRGPGRSVLLSRGTSQGWSERLAVDEQARIRRRRGRGAVGVRGGGPG